MQSFAEVEQEFKIASNANNRPVNDRYVDVIGPKVAKIRPAVIALREVSKNLQEESRQLLQYYGEDPDKSSLESLMHTLLTFTDSFARIAASIKPTIAEVGALMVSCFQPIVALLKSHAGKGT